MIQLIRSIPSTKHLPDLFFDNERVYTCSFTPEGDNEIIDVSINSFGGRIYLPKIDDFTKSSSSDYWEIVEKTSSFLHIHYGIRFQKDHLSCYNVILTMIYDAATGKFITSHVPITDKIYLTPNMWVGISYLKSVIEKNDFLDDNAYFNALSILKEHYRTVQRINIHEPITGSLLTNYCRDAEELINYQQRQKFISSWIEDVYLSLLGRKHGKIIDSSYLLRNTDANTCFTSDDLESHCDIRSDIDLTTENEVIDNQLNESNHVITEATDSNQTSSFKSENHAMITNQLVIFFLLGIGTDLTATLKSDASKNKLYITKGMHWNRYSELDVIVDLADLKKSSPEVTKWTLEFVRLIDEFICDHLPDKRMGINQVEVLYVPCTIVITIVMDNKKKHVAIIPILELLPSIPMFDSEVIQPPTFPAE